MCVCVCARVRVCVRVCVHVRAYVYVNYFMRFNLLVCVLSLLVLHLVLCVGETSS